MGACCTRALFMMFAGGRRRMQLAYAHKLAESLSVNVVLVYGSHAEIDSHQHCKIDVQF